MKKLLKKSLAVLLVVVMTLTAAPLNGFVGLDLLSLFDFKAEAATYSGTCGTNLTWSFDTSTGVLEITGTGAMTNWSSSSSSVPWYSYRGDIKTVNIGNNVITIGDYAFYSCDSLTSVTIGNSVTIIGDYALEYCDSLTSITIPDSVTTIGGSAFYACDSLTSITIPDSVTTIGIAAFTSCKSLTSFNVDSDNEYYFSDNYGVLFNKNKTELIQYPIGNTRKSYTIPDSVTTIGYDAFLWCDNLTSITISDSVTTIGGSAFYACDSLTSITIPDSVTTIDNYAFEYCDSLTSVTIPDSVTTIGNRAFSSCYSLASITIPDSITTIGYGMFYHCDSLTSITIGNSVTTIGDYAFYGCDSLADVYYTGTQEQWNAISIGSYNSPLTSATIYYNNNPSDTGGDSGDNDDNTGDTPGGDMPVTPEPESGNKTVLGTFESQTLIVSDDWWTTEIKVDGKSYTLEKDYAHSLDLTNNEDKYKNKKVVIVVKNDKVVWLGTVEDIKCDLNCSVTLSHNSLAYAYKKYNEETIRAYVYVSSTNLSGFCGDVSVLADIPEIKTYLSSVKLTSDNPDLLSFDGKSSTSVSYNPKQLIKFGTSCAEIVFEIDVNQSYKIDKDKEYESVIIKFEAVAESNSKTVTAKSSAGVAIKNMQASKPIPSQPSNPSAPVNNVKTASKELENAMNNSAVTLDADISGTLNELFTSKQLDAIGAMILSQVAMASAPEETFQEHLSEKVIKKVFDIDKNWFGIVSEGSLAVTVCNNTKYGEVEVKFTCDYYNYEIGGEKYAFKGDIDYEIIGGKGVKNLPSEFKKSGLAGGLVGADVEAFCEAAWEVANDMLKESYDLAWGNDANKAADIIFGESVNEILSETKYDDVSGLVWEMLITPAKKVKIECPVDVYVYNSDDELVAAVENNIVIKTSENADITVEGDTKTVWLFDDSYYIVYKSLAEYDMTVTVEEYGYSDAHLRTTVIDDIPLNVGTDFKQIIDESFLDETDYSLVSDDGEKYSPTSDEVKLHIHQTDANMELIEEASCSHYGVKCAVCSICYEWYKEIIPQKAHIDNDSNDECDECGEKILRIDVVAPSTTTINYGETLVLTLEEFELPEGYVVEWIVDGSGFSKAASEDGTECRLTSTANGTAIVTAKIVDENGEAVLDAEGNEIIDTITLKSNAGFFQKLISFFKNLFGMNRIIY